MIILLLLALLFAVPSFAQDSKVSELPEATGLLGTDILYVVQDPGGTPTSTFATIDDVVAAGSGVTSITLDQAFDNGDTIDGANSFANAMCIGDGDDAICVYTHASNGPLVVCSIAGVENDCDYYRILAAGKNWGVKDSGGVARFYYTEGGQIHVVADIYAESTGMNLGSTTKAFQDLFIHGSGTYGSHSIQITGAPDGNRVVTLPNATDTLMGKATTDTMTNKTLDAEGTGNVVTIPFTVWLPFAACQNTTASLIWDSPTSNAATAACITGTNTQKGVADFDQTTDESLQTTWMIPTGFTGAIDAKIMWLGNASSTNPVAWCVQLIKVSDGETGDPAFPAQATGNCVSDAGKGTANQYNVASLTSVTCTSCAAGDVLHIRVSRDPDETSTRTDTFAADARGIGLELTYRRAM